MGRGAIGKKRAISTWETVAIDRNEDVVEIILYKGDESMSMSNETGIARYFRFAENRTDLRTEIIAD